jgi:hypothetical protein
LKVARNSSIFSFSSLPGGFLVCAALVLLFEALLSRVPEYALTEAPHEQLALQLKGELVDRHNDFDLLILGGCTSWAAIRPLVLQQEVNATAFNLSVNGAQTFLMSYVLLTRYLNNCIRKPALVVLELSASSLFYRYGMNTVALRDFIVPWFRLDDDFTGELSPPLRRECLKLRLLNLIPSFKYQYLLRKDRWLLRIRRANSGEFEWYKAFYQKEKGFYNEELDPGKRPVAQVRDIGGNYKNYELSEHNLLYVDKILAALSRAGIKVVVCTEPVRDDEMGIWKQYNLRERLNATIRSLVSRFDNVVLFCDLRDSASDPGYFVDSAHLNSSGAELYTRTLAREIKQLDIFTN